MTGIKVSCSTRAICIGLGSSFRWMTNSFGVRRCTKNSFFFPKRSPSLTRKISSAAERKTVFWSPCSKNPRKVKFASSLRVRSEGRAGGGGGAGGGASCLNSGFSRGGNGGGGGAGGFTANTGPKRFRRNPGNFSSPRVRRSIRTSYSPIPDSTVSCLPDIFGCDIRFSWERTRSCCGELTTALSKAPPRETRRTTRMIFCFFMKRPFERRSKGESSDLRIHCFFSNRGDR